MSKMRSGANTGPSSGRTVRQAIASPVPPDRKVPVRPRTLDSLGR
jgi:hypothetical protein